MARRTAVLTVKSPGGCCSSVLGSPLAAADADELAKGFAALGDPVGSVSCPCLRLRRGRGCVCNSWSL